MKKYAALFSGQGSQYPGMGKELYSQFHCVRAVYECAQDIFGFDVKSLSFEGPETQMTRTLYAQPLIFTLSLACFEAAKDQLPPPDAVAGHSLGEFAALCVAGAYSIEDGMRIVRARAEAMDSLRTDGAMIAVMSGDIDAIRAACSAAGGLVIPVNFNQPGQTVIAGETDAVLRAARFLEQDGVRVVRLNVGAAFHTEMMRPAADAFRASLEGIQFLTLKTVFYSNLTGGKLVVDDYPDYFARHMVSPVRFSEQMTELDADGIDICVEFGPKKTVATLAKKNVRRFTAVGVEDAKSISAAAALFQTACCDGAQI